MINMRERIESYKAPGVAAIREMQIVLGNLHEQLEKIEAEVADLRTVEESARNVLERMEKRMVLSCECSKIPQELQA